MIFDGRLDRPWKPEETRKNELVFIGRDLNSEQLRQDFQTCLIYSSFQLGRPYQFISSNE